MTGGVIKRGRKLKRKLGHILANPSVYPLLPWLIILSALLLSTRSKAQSKFDETSTGIETSTPGLTQADLDNLDQETQKQVERFKKGRASSAVSSSSRYSGSLELHDSNYDGISDHGNSRNDLEGGLEKSAIGQDGLPDDSTRKSKLLKAKTESQEAALGRKCTPQNPCNNSVGTSANIVDVGPAHDRDNPAEGQFVEHRVYDITEKAKTASEEAGKSYAERVKQEAAIYKITDPRRVRSTGKQNEILVLVDQNGKQEWIKQTVAPEIDLVRNEVAWLEDQKERHLQNEWKLRRATRFAGDALGDDSSLGETVSSIYKKNLGQNSSNEDRKLASAIVDARIASRSMICLDPLKNPKKCSPSDTPVAAEDYVKEQKLSAAQRARFYEGVSKVVANDPRQQKSRNEEIKKLEKCLGIDANCDASLEELSKNSNSQKDYVYSDTREYIYNRMQKENLGSLNNMGRSISNADFNASIDTKAKNSKPYQAYMNQIKENQKAWAEFIATEKQKENEYKWYKSPYTQSDANKYSAKELFRLNASKNDNRTLKRPASINSPASSQNKAVNPRR